MSSRFSWGILGAAAIAKRIGRAIGQVDGHEIVAIGTREEERGRSLARVVAPEATVYKGYERVLQDPRVDAVYIPLPNHLHCEWTVKAAEAGKHVLCEKPLAVSRSEVVQQTEACRRAGVVLSEAVFFHYGLRTREVVRMVRSGVVGEVRAVSALFGFHLDQGPNIRWQRAMGGGALFDIGSHMVNLTLWLMGRAPVTVRAVQDSYGDVDLSTAVVLGFEGGATANVWVSFGAAPVQTMVVVGDSGCLYVPRPISPWQVGEEPPGPLLGVAIEEGGRRREVALPGGDNPYVSMVESFAGAVRNHHETETPASAALETIDVIEACHTQRGETYLDVGLAEGSGR
jgi:xylose dehydrogenase (NAD/NADP)